MRKLILSLGLLLLCLCTSCEKTPNIDRSKITSMQELMGYYYDDISSSDSYDRAILDYERIREKAVRIVTVKSIDDLTKESAITKDCSMRKVEAKEWFFSDGEEPEQFEIKEYCIISDLSGGKAVRTHYSDLFPMIRGDHYLCLLALSSAEEGGYYPVVGDQGRVDLSNFRLNHYLHIAVQAVAAFYMEESDFPEGMYEALLNARQIEPHPDYYNYFARANRENLWTTVPIRSGYEYEGMEFDLPYYYDEATGIWCFDTGGWRLAYDPSWESQQ